MTRLRLSLNYSMRCSTMAQWRKLEDLEANNPTILEKINFIYKGHDFEFDIRKSCSEFIETQNWADQSVNEGVVPVDWFEHLLATLKIIGQSGDLKHKTSVKHHMETLKAMPDYERSSFFEVMSRCLKAERLLIESFLQEPDGRRVCDQDIATENVEIRRQMDESSHCLTALEQTVGHLKLEQDNFNSKHVQLTAQLGKLDEDPNISTLTEQKNVESQISTLIQNLCANRKFAADSLEQIYVKFGDLFRDVWTDIDSWKEQQKLQITGLDKPREGIVDILSQMCGRAGELLTSALRLTERIKLIYLLLQFPEDPLVGKVNEIEDRLVALLQKHVMKIFVVDRPPPQIIRVVNSKSNNVFPMGVRLLGTGSLGLDTTMPKVTAKLYHEKQLGNVLVTQETPAMCRVTDGNDKLMQERFSKKGKAGSNAKSCDLIADFNKVGLENFQRGKGKSDENVTDVKYFVVFYTQVTVRNKSAHLAVCSLPIVLTSHVNQECMAKGTLIWNAAFSLENGQPFDEAKEAPWAKVAEVLNAIHMWYLNTERRLTPEQLNYLGSIALGKPDDVEADFSEMMISRNRLLKDHVHKAKQGKKDQIQSNFSFWKWFYACMNLLKNHLKKEWENGLIYGFVSKDVAHKLLTEHPNGTFLLRFSENYIENSSSAEICGRITVAVIKQNPRTGERRVFHVKDKMKREDIMKSGLVKILDSLDGQDESLTNERLLHHLWLWPSKPLDEVFGPFLPECKNDDDDDDAYTGYKCARISIPILWGNDTRAESELDDASTVASPGRVMSVETPGSTLSAPSPGMSAPSPGMSTPSPGMSAASPGSVMSGPSPHIMMSAPSPYSTLSAPSPDAFVTSVPMQSNEVIVSAPDMFNALQPDSTCNVTQGATGGDDTETGLGLQLLSMEDLQSILQDVGMA